MQQAKCSSTDFIDVAKQLEQFDTEGARRGSLNRAYYAAYHALEPLARLVPGSTQTRTGGGLAHAEVPRRLRDWQFLPVELTGLKRLKRLAVKAAGDLAASYAVREQADYNLNAELDSEVVELQMLRVKDLLNFALQAQNEFERITARTPQG